MHAHYRVGCITTILTASSAGHRPDVPVHFSRTSHSPVEARHVVVALFGVPEIRREKHG